jgi:hypothetical protein
MEKFLTLEALQKVGPLCPLATLAAARVHDTSPLATPVRCAAALFNLAFTVSIPLRGFTFNLPFGGVKPLVVRPLGGPDALGTNAALMSAALYGCCAIKGMQLCLAWPGTDAERDARGPHHVLFEHMWYFLPVLRVEGDLVPMSEAAARVNSTNKRSSTSSSPTTPRSAAFRPTREDLGTTTYLGVATRAAVDLAIAAGKWAFVPFAIRAARAVNAAPRAYVVGGVLGWLETSVRAASLLPVFATSAWGLDVVAALVTAVSVGRYKLLDFSNFPVLATSPSEFWGTRYNRLVSMLLSDAVAKPMRRRGWGRGAAVMASFSVSGLLHAFVAHCAFGPRGRTAAAAFFVVHGGLCLGEAELERRCAKWHARLCTGVSGWLAWNTCLVLTAPLYVGLFADHAQIFLDSLDIA